MKPWQVHKYKREVVSFERVRPFSPLYDVKLECGHYAVAQQVKDGVCPKNVSCMKCWAQDQAKPHARRGAQA